MSDGDPAAFDVAWGRFASWLSVHCPVDHAALRSPASAKEIRALEAQLGFPLHPQLRALLERHNGVMKRPEPDNYHAGAFLPLGHRLSGTDLIAQQYESMKDGLAEIITTGWPEEDLRGHAHQWVEFARPNDGGTAFIDHRPGPTYGHVFEMGIGSGDIEGTKWASSLAKLFDQLATSLETGEPFRHYRPTSCELPSGHHCLTWDIGQRTEGDGIQNWPPPRRPDPPVRLLAIRPGQGPKLGRLIGGSAPLTDPVASLETGISIPPLHTSGVIVKDSAGCEDTTR
ncbi:SMI1/KNR4 family protein [Streptomyces sp. NPDC003857]